MKKISVIFSSIVLATSLLVTSIAQAKDPIKIGVSFRMLSDVGY